MNREQMVFIIAALLMVMSRSAIGGPIYDWVCDSANCGGDTGFSSSLEISDSAFVAGDFTGVAGNILNWTTTSGVGAGYTLSLANMLNAASGTTADQTNIRMVLNGDKSEVAQLLDISSGTNITFFDTTIGRVDFFEGTNYSVGSLQDSTMNSNNQFSPVNIAGQFVRRVPEPYTLLLFASGLFVLCLIHRKQAAIKL